MLIVITLASVSGGITLSLPQRSGFNVKGGLSQTPEFMALLAGLSINAAAGISEIVRSGMEAVPAGQWEAANALGLKRGQIIRLVVLPQALRVIVPLMTSSYLSLTKNSSLAVAIGYPDLVSILNTTANQTGQALEAIVIMLGIYLSISLGGLCHHEPHRCAPRPEGALSVSLETAAEGPGAPSLLRRLAPSPVSLVLSGIFLLLVLLLLVPLFRWAVLDATWSGTSEQCRASGGACWAFLREKTRFILLGFYPLALQYQAVAASLVLVAISVMSMLPRFWGRRLLLLWPLAITAAIVIMSGWPSGIWVPTQQWGGLPLTLLLATIGFAAAFPLGIALALGRRSNMLVLRSLSMLFIEVMRGVPLIAVLYFSTLLLPLMLPSGASLDKLLRAQTAIVLFVSAYMAEIVRAGLQSVPSGQYEAASALGLKWPQMMRLVILPQALRAVIPAFVTLGIGIFLDTTLVIVIGLFDLLNTARAAATDAGWLGFYYEAYGLAAVIYFAIAYSASRYSRWLEQYLRPAAGHRK